MENFEIIKIEQVIVFLAPKLLQQEPQVTIENTYSYMPSLTKNMR